MTVRILDGDCRSVLATLPDESVHCVVTSPPYYGLRDYGNDAQIGLEQTPEAFVAELVGVFREVRRVLRSDGTLFLNLGDSYGGIRTTGRNDTDRETPGGRGGSFRDATRTHVGVTMAKQLLGIPWRVAFALQADGWYLRQDIIWHKPNPMPESVKDRCTKAHEYLFLLAKSERYHFDAEAIAEPAVDAETLQGKRPRKSDHISGDAGYDGHRTRVSLMSAQEPRDTRNRRSVWTVSTKPFSGAHFATFPPDLIEPCILAGCPKGGTVLDPFGGAGTTGLVADRAGRDAILIELNPAYSAMARTRIAGDCPMFAEVAE